MDVMSGSDSTDNINKRAVAVFIIVVIAVLALAVWGGTFLGKSDATARNQELSSNLASAQDQLSQLQSTSASLQKANDALQTQFTSAQDQLSQMQATYADLQKAKDALQTQLTSAQDQLSQLQSRYGSLQDRNAALQTQLTSAQQNVAMLQTQLTSSQQNVAMLQTQLTSAQQNVATLQTQLTSAQQNIATLQTQLAAWYTWSLNAPASPKIILSATSGPAGASVTVTGSGFAANTDGNIVFDTNRNGTFDPGEPVQNVTTSSTGTFATALVVPSVPPGTYPVSAAFPLGEPAQASAIFSVITGQ